MKLKSILESNQITLSFEVFPPKPGTDFETVKQAAYGVASLQPSYMSVTYGAGGSNRENTLAIARGIQENYQIPTVAHLTCVGATTESIQKSLNEMKKAGIENILALRGDRPKEWIGEPFVDYRYASQLVQEIRFYGGFYIGGACYPEGHPESPNKFEDIRNLKKKVDSGCDYLTTQMFFDNHIYFNFLYRIREAGIEVPVIPGIMPITRAVQVKNAIKLSGCNVPERFLSLVDRFGDKKEAMQQAGIAYATDQIIDLIANGVNHIHVYSMNHPDVAKGIQQNLSHILSI